MGWNPTDLMMIDLNMFWSPNDSQNFMSNMRGSDSMNVFSGKPYGSTPQVDPLGTTLAWFSGLYLKAWKTCT